MLVRGTDNGGNILFALRKHHTVRRTFHDAVPQLPQITETFARGMDKARLFIFGNLTLSEHTFYDVAEILVGFLAGFVRQQATRQNIRKLWNSVLKANLGEFDTKKTVAELIQNHLGLPVRKKILFKTLDQISNLSAKEIATLYEDLSNDLRMMRGVLAEQNLSIEKVNGKTQIKRIGFHRYWWEAHGQEFAWIPLSLMP